jgi:predicted  nucleic acid-binding Zn-ribbon protein
MDVLSSATLIPLGVVLTIFGIIVGFVRWLESMHNTGKANMKRLVETDNDVKALRDKIGKLEETHSGLAERLVRFETKIEELPNTIKVVVSELLNEYLKK